MNQDKLKRLTAGAVILGSSISLFLYFYHSPPFNSKPHQALGDVAADEAVKLIGPGGRIILIVRDTVFAESPATETQLKSFHARLKAASLNTAATNIIKVDPLRVTAVPSGDFLEIARKAGDADVIVSFLGPPVFTDAQVARLGGKRPKLVAFCTGAMPDQVDLPRVFEQKLLHVAIISRASPATAGPEPANLRAWFDRMYQVITPANLAELPSPRGTRREVKPSP